MWPLLIALLGLGIYFNVAPRYYTATAQMLINVQKPRIISGEAVVPSLDTSRYLIDPVIDSQVEILRSKRIAEQVIKTVGLLEDPEYQSNPGLLASVRDYFTGMFDEVGEGVENTEAANDKTDVIPRSVVSAFLRGLDVRRKGLTLILFVQFTDKRPARAAEIANAVVDAFLDDQRALQLRAARSANKLLQARVAVLREQVLTAETKLQSYREANNLISIGGRTVDEQEIIQTIAQIIAARTFAGNKLAELRQIKKVSTNPQDFTSISKVLNSGIIRDLRLQHSTIMRNLANAVSKFGERDNRVQTLRAESQNLQKDIDKEIERIIENTQYDYDVAKTQVKILESELATLKQQSVRGSRLSIELAELERDAKSTRDLYLNLLSRLKETLVRESLLYPDARIVEAAEKPRAPSSPKKLITLALALMGSLGLGVTWAFMKDHLSTVLRATREVEEVLGFGQTTPLPRLAVGSQKINSVAVDQPNSQFAQAIFSINRAIWLHPQGPDGRRIVAIASALDGEGKTTIAANLANYSAALNTKTLLVDCDFRNPGISSHMPHSSTGSNIADVLQGKAAAQESTEQIGDSSLYILRAPNLGTVSHPMELLSSSQMQNLLTELQNEFQLIVLDTSALLPSVDARALLDFADCSIFVIEAEKSTTDNVLQAYRVASDLKSNTAVVAFNKSAAQF